MARNTKWAIIKAYIDLIKIKNIDKVTVKDVVEVCGITRQTFYYHFQDLQDVLEWGLRMTSDTAVQRGAEAGSVEAALHLFLDAADRNRQVGRKIFTSQKKPQLCDMIFHMIESLLFAIFKEKNADASIPVDELDFAVHFYAHAVTGILYDVIMNEDIDLDSTVQQISVLMSPLTSRLNMDA